MRAGLSRVTSAEDAARRATDLAWEASKSTTFGVGGFLMRRDGTVVAEAVNAVIRDGHVLDPTAHVERQLVDWYMAARRNGLRDEPADLTIVSSLDPCAMCAGAILTAGLQAVAVAEDPDSGVHSCGHPQRVPRALRTRADASLSFFATAQRQCDSPHVELLAAPISDHILEAARRAFFESLSTVRRTISHSDDPTDASLDLLRSDATIQASLAPTVQIAQDNFDIDLAPHDDRSLLVGPDGRALLTAIGAGEPTRASLIELVRGYAMLRRLARDRHAIHLPHPRACTVVALDPGRDADVGLMALGALGSSLEDRALSAHLPSLGVLTAKDAQFFAEILASMPPLYNEMLGMSVGEVTWVNGRLRRLKSSTIAAAS